MPDINRKDVLPDDLLEAPVILTKRFEAMLVPLKEFLSIAKEYDKVLSSNTKTTKEHRDRTKELTDEQKVITQIQKQVSIETAKQSEKYQELLAIKNKVQQQNKEMAADRELTKKFKEEHASITELTKALQANRVAYSALRGESERNSAKGKELLSTIQSQKKSLDELNLSIGKGKVEAEGFGNSLKEMFEKSGEGGERVIGLVGSLRSVMTSGWTIVGTAIAAATGAVEQFFERTAEGGREHRLILAKMNIEWEIFKNNAATAGSKIWDGLKKASDFFEASEETKAVHRKLRYAQADEATRKQMDLEDAQRKKAIEISNEKAELFKKELVNIKVNADAEFEAAKKRLIYSDKEENGVKVRLAAAREENEILKKQGEINLEIAETKAEITKAEILNNKGSLSLTKEDQLQLAEAQEAAHKVKTQNILDEAERLRRISKIAKESGKADKQETINDNDDWHLEDLRKASTEEIKIQQEKDKKEQEEQKKSDEIIFKQAEEQNKSDVEAANTRWENYLEREKVMHEKKVELSRVASESIVRITEQQFEGQIQKHEAYLKNLKENYQEEMSLASGNKIAQAQITSRFREEEKRAEAEVRKEKIKQAKFEKSAGLLTIAIKTAEAVMKDVAAFPETKGEPFATIDEAMGALMAAAILSKPLPSYQVGTDYHKGGKAIVGEAGFELYKTPSGKYGFTPNEASVMDLPTGTQVETHDDTLRILALAGLKNSYSDKQVNFSTKIIEKLDEVKNSIENQKQTQDEFYPMISGYYRFQKEKENFTKRVIVERYGSTIK